AMTSPCWTSSRASTPPMSKARRGVSASRDLRSRPRLTSTPSSGARDDDRLGQVRPLRRAAAQALSLLQVQRDRLQAMRGVPEGAYAAADVDRRRAADGRPVRPAPARVAHGSDPHRLALPADLR